MPTATKQEFERLILPHLGAAYSLARWLLRHPQDAEDAVQQSLLRAYKSFGGYAGGNAQAWLMSIVRNTCFSQIDKRRTESNVVVLHDAAVERGQSLVMRVPDGAPLADTKIIAVEDQMRVHRAIAALPAPFREALVLREFHEMGYREIADVVGAPVGTVMSRLSRARERLTELLAEQSDSNDVGKTS